MQYIEKWYGEKMNRPYRQRAQVIARARNGQEAARDPLLQMLQSDESFYWRAVAANLLERWIDEPAVSRETKWTVEGCRDAPQIERQVQPGSGTGGLARPA